MRSFKRLLIASLAVVLSATLVLTSSAIAKSDDSCPGNSCSAPGQMNKLTNGSSDIKGNLKTERHIYYVGDSLKVAIKFSRGSDLLAEEFVNAHVVVISPNTYVSSFPVENVVGANDQMFFDVDLVTAETLPEGQYQVALIATIPDGDPTNLQDWYNGFRGMLDMEGILISSEPLPEDANMDGECDFDADADGFCDVQNLEDDDDEEDSDEEIIIIPEIVETLPAE